MTQRILAFLVLCCLLATGPAAAADSSTTAPKTSAPTAAPRQTVESSFSSGLACLRKHDATCAQIALAGMPPTSPLAKILEAGIAAEQQEYDSVLRLLIPLQADSSLPPQASASLHATLAQAYENQGNLLPALTQRSLAEAALSEPAEIDASQAQTWRLLSTADRQSLLDIRGESPNAVVQGWIDLALAAQHSSTPAQAIEQWRNAYTEHPAGRLLAQLTPSDAAVVPAAPTASAGTQKQIALLLPLEVPAFANAAYAVQAGLLAAIEATQARVTIQVYPTLGDRASAAAVYQRAIADGAQYVIGPLTRGEVSALETADMVSVPTVALNTLDSPKPPAAKLALFGLPVEDEARQLAQLARRMGMQSATIVAADAPLSARMVAAFAAEWAAQFGTLVQQLTFSAAAPPAELKHKLAEHPADMIFLAVNAEQARQVRPYLDPATPTFGLSHLYDGTAHNPQNEVLNAVHFVDMPWLINPAAAEFAAYTQFAAGLSPGEAQRWFAVGADAWHILMAVADGRPTAATWNGLSGQLALREGRVVRTLSLAQFRTDGIALEPTP